MTLFVPHLPALLRSLLRIHHPAATRPLLATLAAARVRLQKPRRAAQRLSTPAASADACAPGWGLTQRETEVATWLTRAKSNGEIAVILGMARRTVEKHMERILGKLGVENRTAAALLIVTEDERAGSR